MNLTKDEIRALSRRAGLPTWDEPASACLSSRIPYHTEVTDEKLRTIERAEQAVRALGFRVFRVRHHDELARVEIARDEMSRALEPGDRRGDRAGAQSGRLSLRHARFAGLPAGQPERRIVPAANVIRLRSSVLLLALVFLALHLPYLPASLEDLDSINFALGLRQFDVAHHQPHPPGYPVFILIAKAVHAVVPSEATALGLVSIAGGALGVLAAAALFRRIDGGAAPANWLAAAVVVTMTTPLYWFTAVRPLSDSIGLAAALAVRR